MSPERSTLVRATSLAVAAAIVVGLLWTTRGGQSMATAEELPPLVLVPATPNHAASLRDRLIVGLRARLPSELQFIELVLAKVAAGELPEQLVNETFFWSRKHVVQTHVGYPQRPIVYFQPAMVARAKRIGVVL